MQVSIVITCHNQSQYLRTAIDSALSQRGIDAEIIVVDDGSIDGSAAVIKEYGASIKAVFQKPSGACAARNKGLELCAGRYVKFLDADDFLCPEALLPQVTLLDQIRGERLSVFGDVVWVDSVGNRLLQPPAADESMSEAERMILHAPLISAPLHVADCVRSVGGFDPRVPRGQEYDLHMRMWLSGCSFIYQRVDTFCYRQHSNARISSRDGEDSIARGRFEALCRHVKLAESRLGCPLPNDAARAFALNFWRIGRRCLQCGNRAEADNYFRESKRLSSRGMFGSNMYQLLTRLVGPYISECIVQSVRS